MFKIKNIFIFYIFFYIELKDMWKQKSYVLTEDAV